MSNIPSPWQAVTTPVNQAMSSFYGSTPVKALTGFSRGVLGAFNPVPEIKAARGIAEEKGMGAFRDPNYLMNSAFALLTALPGAGLLKAGVKGGIPAAMNYGQRVIGGRIGKSFLAGLGGLSAAEALQQDKKPVDTSMFGQFLNTPYSIGQNQSGQVVTNLERTGPLGNKFTTDLVGDKYVLLEKPNPLRPNEMTQTYVTESSLRNGIPAGAKIAGYGYQVQRPSPLSGRLENTIVSEKDLINMGGTPVRGLKTTDYDTGSAGFDLSGIGRGAYNAAMGAANSEYQIGKKAAQRDLRTMLQQLGQTATGVGLDTSMAAAQAGMDTSPGALDVGLDYIEGARAQGEAGARGDFAKTLGQLEQRRLRQQASAAQAAAQAQQNAVLNLYLASQGLL